MPSSWTPQERRDRATELGIEVDPEDEWLLFAYTWVRWGHAVGTSVWNKETKRQQHALLHHCIVGYPIDGSDVDHIDRNIFNNRRSNLRYITHAQNALNSDRSDAAEHIQRTAYGRFQVSLRRDNIYHYLGNYATYVEAEEVRDAWLRTYMDLSEPGT
jgi:hypothetical protein